MATSKKSIQKVGKYEIQQKIGEGGFGIVYKALDRSLERMVALKQLKLELSSSPEYLARFKQESRLMGAMSHPNIIKIIEVVEEMGRTFLVMDYMPNGSLVNRLEEGHPMTLEQTLEVLKPIGRAIDYAHGKNLVHRDIKPSNILFMEDDDPVLSDFGLVKMLNSVGLSSSGAAFGTPEYMAPEQILCKELTPAADVYALGVVAYQMLSGQLPFPGSTPFEVQEGHVHKALPDILALNPLLPDELSGVFNKVLAKDPLQRHVSARDFLGDLDVATRQQTEEQVREKMVQADELLNEKKFSDALPLLKEVYALKPTEELQALITEARRREKIWKQYLVLQEKEFEIQAKIQELEHMETWILENDLDSFTILDETQETENIDSQSSGTSLSEWIYFFMVVIVLIAIFSGIFAFL